MGEKNCFEKIDIADLIIVEGKDDISALKKAVNADIMITNGLGLTKKRLDEIAAIAQKRGVIIFTDPDYPGEQIRKKISQRVKCYHAFVDRKHASNGKKLGVAECDKEEIIRALKEFVFLGEDNHSLSFNEFCSLQLTGPNSQERREKVAKHFSLGHCNSKTLFKRLNMLNITYQQIKEIL